MKYQALMGFINYKTKESALACLMGASTSETIKNLFMEDKVYVNLHVPKFQYQNLDKARQRPNPQQMDPFQMVKNL